MQTQPMNNAKISIIDLQGINDPAQLPTIAAKISAALKATGFMYVENHGIPAATIKQLRQSQRDFFTQAPEIKQQVAINTDNRGYLGQGEARMHGAKKHDQKEVFFWGAELAEDHPDRVNGLPLCGANQWPSQPADFTEAVQSYAGEIARLGNLLLKAIALALEIDEDFFAKHYQSPMTRGQLIRYPPTQGGQDDFGVAPHTDFGCITLLLQETPGLEVLDKNDEWIPAPPIDGTLVINIGDLLERWTDGRLPSTRHRVRNTTGTERYSIAMFHDPDPTAQVDPGDMDSNSSNFEAVRAADYISGRNRGAFAHFGEIEKVSDNS